jgi:hypothetical protein
VIPIHQILQGCAKDLEANFFAKSFDTIPLIEYCVDKSTIRAFQSKKGHVKQYKPLSIFRVWASNYLNKHLIDSLNARQNLHSIRNKALSSLKKFWQKKDGGKPLFYQFNKLIDLLFKSLPLWKKLNAQTKRWLFKNINVPLDKFSLSLLRQQNKNLGLRKSVSMNHVSEANYKLLQTEIKHLCKNLPVILFDLYAWDTNHKPREFFELIKIDTKTAKRSYENT